MQRTKRWAVGVLLIGALHLPAHATVDSTDILIKALLEKHVIADEDAAAVRVEIANIRQTRPRRGNPCR